MRLLCCLRLNEEKLFLSFLVYILVAVPPATWIEAERGRRNQYFSGGCLSHGSPVVGRRKNSPIGSDCGSKGGLYEKTGGSSQGGGFNAEVHL
jgi:hypothetical protein